MRELLCCLLSLVLLYSPSFAQEGGGEQAKRKPNRLINEKSPYLLQHAHNPVNWYPWGEEAFKAAREQNKPIFLSIGYSTCHWCHVMERESFEDEEIAGKLNSDFIAIKVDREERPDIDEVYMAAVMATNNGRGGWPLSAFLTSDGKPFFLGTYFPPRDDPRRGLPGFFTLLGRISEAWRDERAKIDETANNIASFLEQDVGPKPAAGAWTTDALESGFQEIARSYDQDFGGFGSPPRYAPKFPRTSMHDFLMAFSRRTGNATALQIVTNTLEKMANGGIHDHVGKGFHRYSTDRKWLVPHFEKMLYDNSLISKTYVDAYRLTGNERFLDVARDCLEYLLTRMHSPDGAFYSAEDADSEGEEGKYYVFSRDELAEHLGEKSAALFAARFGVTKEGNFERTDKSVLHVRETIDALSKRFERTPAEIRESLEASRVKLLAVRGKRVPPLKDDKILTDWNAMAISALAYAHQVTSEKRYLDAATTTLAFLNDKLVDKDGLLLHRFREGESRFRAYFEDYAFLTTALLDLYEASLDLEHLRAASKLAEKMIAEFQDAERGGFFHTSPGHEKLIVRTKEFYDGAVPSGNSVAARALIRLAAYTEDAAITAAVATIAKLGASLFAEGPSRYPNMLYAAETALAPRVDVVLVVPADDPKLADLAAMVHRRYISNLRIVRLTKSELGKISDTLPFVKAVSGSIEAEVYGLARRGDGEFTRFDDEAGLRTILK